MWVVEGWASVKFLALPPGMFTAYLALGVQTRCEILKAEIQVEIQTILTCAVLHILPSCVSFPMSLVDFFLLTGAGVPARGIPTKSSLLCSKHTRKWRMKHWKSISCLSFSCHLQVKDTQPSFHTPVLFYPFPMMELVEGVIPYRILSAGHSGVLWRLSILTKYGSRSQQKHCQDAM